MEINPNELLKIQKSIILLNKGEKFMKKKVVYKAIKDKMNNLTIAEKKLFNMSMTTLNEEKESGLGYIKKVLKFLDLNEDLLIPTNQIMVEEFD